MLIRFRILFLRLRPGPRNDPFIFTKRRGNIVFNHSNENITQKHMKTLLNEAHEKQETTIKQPANAKNTKT